MTFSMDRRSVLTSLGALGVMGCSSAPATAPAPQDQAARPAVAMQAFDLSALERRNGGRLGFVAHDTGSGRKLVWRGEERFVYCSTFKMYLSAATLLRVQAGHERLDRAILITAADMISHAPTTEPAVGGTLTVEQLMKATVELSDNPAANILIREMGGIDALRAWYRSIGDTTTNVDRLEPFMNRRDGDKDTAQPRQIATNLGWILSTYQPLGLMSQYALLWNWLIQSPTGQGRIKAGVPQGWTLAHKTGTGGSGQTNDIGVIHPPTGEPIRIAVYYDAPADLAEVTRDAVIAQATRLALGALGRDGSAA